LHILWIVPIVLFYADISASVSKRAHWTDACTRYLSFPIAIFTIQGLVIIKKISNQFRKIDFFLVAFVAWDLLYINKPHLWDVEMLYPFVVLIIFLLLILFKPVIAKSKQLASKEKAFCNSFRHNPPGSSGFSNTITKRWAVYVLISIILVGGLYFIQIYRDNTRHIYYREHTDLHVFPRIFVNGWEFLDQAGEKKTITLTMDWAPPGHNWFFYPLFGRWLQNDIVYISSKYKWEVPTWLHQGSLRGDDFSIWSHNVIRKEVDYILVQKPWPIELKWIRYHNKFKLVFSDKNCRIFKYIREDA